MSEVIVFKPKDAPEAEAEAEAPEHNHDNDNDPLVWVCGCGCSTFELLSNGQVRCAVCEEVSHADSGGWEPPATDKQWDGPVTRDIHCNGDVDFAKRKLQKHAEDPEACAIIVFKTTGAVHTWAMVDTQEQFDWFKANMDIATTLVGSKLAAREK